jgi:iron complex outermembrane recepter protein
VLAHRLYSRRTAWLLALALPPWFSGSVSAASPAEKSSVGALKGMSLDELMDLEVTSVSKQPQKLLQAPFAIQVIPSDEDSLEVAQINSHDWAISTRGFNANRANKLLVPDAAPDRL